VALTRTAVPRDPQGTTKRAQMARQATNATAIRVAAAGSVRRRITESLRTLAAKR
jgi:hypothetical protein